MSIFVSIALFSMLLPSLALDQNPQQKGDYLVMVWKRERRLELYRIVDGARQLVRNYRIALGSQPIGHKQQQGDGATPEGDYYITHKNPRSRFHLSIGVSYPNQSDAESGLSRGLISRRERERIATAIRRREKPPQGTALGGDIFLHGGGVESDWTAGCVALDNKDIEELFSILPLRTPVTIRP